MNDTHDRLAARLLDAVRRTVMADAAGRGTTAGLPSIDVAVIDFGCRGGPRWADVLFSREHPQGLVAAVTADAGAVGDIRFDADLQDDRGDSPAWAAGADWSRLPFEPLTAPAAGGPAAARRFVAPYPASLLKLMVAVGIGIAVDRGIVGWPAALEPMITASDNDATGTCVALLHRCGLLTPEAGNPLELVFAGWGLTTLRIAGTTPAGGWRNADGAGVGRISMTAWDTARLLWLIDFRAPHAPWLAPSTPTLSDATRRHLVGVLSRQQRDEVLSSGSLSGIPGWVPGFPDAPRFAHKTGSTDNYASDAGILVDPPRHAIVAVISSIGRRHAPHARCATSWQLPALGAAVAALLGDDDPTADDPIPDPENPR